MRRYILTLTIVASLAVVAGASPVDIMVGARGYGMGGAYVALADDPSAAYWNPAALVHVEHPSFINCNWIFQNVEGLNVNYANLTLPVASLGTFAAGWLISHATLEYGRYDEHHEVEMVSNDANEHMFSLSFGRKLFDQLLFFRTTSIGLSINRYMFTNSVEDEAGFGFDAALSIEFPYGIRFGVTARNLGAELMGYMLDPELRWGVGYSLLLKEQHRISAEIDGVYKRNRDYRELATMDPAENNIKGFAGLEYAFIYKGWEMAVRGGGNGMVWHNSARTYVYTTGFGCKWLGYSLDYAFTGTTQRDVSMGYGH